MRRRQPFSQSGLTRTEPCVAGESDTNIWPNWAQHQCAVDLKAARRHKRRFLWRRCIQADAQSRRSRTAAAWKPHRDPAGFSRVLRDADLRLSRCDGIERDSSFICWSWIFWRAPPVSQAVTCYRSRCASFGTPELSPVGPIFYALGMFPVLSSPVGKNQHRPDLFWFGFMFHLQGKSNILFI